MLNCHKDFIANLIFLTENDDEIIGSGNKNYLTSIGISVILSMHCKIIFVAASRNYINKEYL
jgi:hypothetical protein